MYAGQSILAGEVCVRIENNQDLVVTYATINDWTIKEAHLWIGYSLSALPKTATGNP